MNQINYHCTIYCIIVYRFRVFFGCFVWLGFVRLISCVFLCFFPDQEEYIVVKHTLDSINVIPHTMFWGCPKESWNPVTTMWLNSRSLRDPSSCSLVRWRLPTENPNNSWFRPSQGFDCDECNKANENDFWGSREPEQMREDERSKKGGDRKKWKVDMAWHGWTDTWQKLPLLLTSEIIKDDSHLFNAGSVSPARCMERELWGVLADKGPTRNLEFHIHNGLFDI